MLFWLIYNTLVLLRMLCLVPLSLVSSVYAVLRASASLFVLFVALGHDVPLAVMSYSVTMLLYDSA